MTSKQDMGPSNLETWVRLQEQLRCSPRTWVITGAAGFIGSHLTEKLLRLGQSVVALDNFSTGSRANLEDVAARVGMNWENCRVIEGDIRDAAACSSACKDADIVLHQAALGSVPRSMKDPLATTANNIDGTVGIFTAARDAEIARVVYASSSSVYGDSADLPKREGVIGKALSPYALSKQVNELHADLFSRAFGMTFVGLRYFNVFGPRQSPDGAYAAVIPRWFHQVLRGSEVQVFGDGETSRDFCFVDNVVQANLLAAMTEDPASVNQIFNVACADQTTLNQLFSLIQSACAAGDERAARATLAYRPFRPGDVRHSLAAIDKITGLLGYAPSHDIRAGLAVAAQWYSSVGV